jgi:hypothetical protein
MGLQTRLDATSLPIPEDNIAFTISTADPLSIGGKSNLTCITSDGVSSEPLFAILSEIIRAVNQDLIVQ